MLRVYPISYQLTTSSRCGYKARIVSSPLSEKAGFLPTRNGLLPVYSVKIEANTITGAYHRLCEMVRPQDKRPINHMGLLMPEEYKDCHTEHCCLKHGCKYGNKRDCTVTTRQVAQSHPCMDCEEEEEDMKPLVSVKFVPFEQQIIELVNLVDKVDVKVIHTNNVYEIYVYPLSERIFDRIDRALKNFMPVGINYVIKPVEDFDASTWAVAKELLQEEMKKLSNAAPTPEQLQIFLHPGGDQLHEVPQLIEWLKELRGKFTHGCVFADCHHTMAARFLGTYDKEQASKIFHFRM